MTAISPAPTSAQLALMNTNWSQTNINETAKPGTIGMYGDSANDKYYFYMTFVANGTDEWHKAASTKKFRILF